MRCLMCAAEMYVTQVVQDDTMPVPGFEHHTLECLECGNIERDWCSPMRRPNPFRQATGVRRSALSNQGHRWKRSKGCERETQPLRPREQPTEQRQQRA